jgi:hypothetical protein
MGQLQPNLGGGGWPDKGGRGREHRGNRERAAKVVFNNMSIEKCKLVVIPLDVVYLRYTLLQKLFIQLLLVLIYICVTADHSPVCFRCNYILHRRVLFCQLSSYSWHNFQPLVVVLSAVFVSPRCNS